MRTWKRCCGILAGLIACGLIVGLQRPIAAPPQENPQFKFDDGQPQAKVDVDDNDVIPTYSNFCRVSGTPEEVILDFGMNSQPFNPGVQKVSINQKVVTSFYTAKRLAAALVLAIQRHEKAYGPIELDVRKRVQPNRQGEPGT